MKKITLNLGDYEQFFKPVEPVKRSYKKANTGAKTKAPKSSSKTSSKKAPRKSASNAKGTSIKTSKPAKTKSTKPKKAKKPTKKRRTPEEMAELRQQRFEAYLEREAQKKMREMERDAKIAEREARAIFREAEKAEREWNIIQREIKREERAAEKAEREARKAEREARKVERAQKRKEREAAARQRTIDAAHKKVEQRFDALHKPGNPSYKNELADLFTERILMLEKGADFSELNDFLRINTPKSFKESYVDLNRVASISNEENRTIAIKEMFTNYIDNTTEFGAAALLKDLDKFESFNYQGMRYASDDAAYAKIYSDITGSKYVSDDVKAIMALMPKNVAVNFYKNYRDLQILANGGYKSFEYDLAAEDYYTKDKNIESFDKSLHGYTKKGSRKEIGGVSLDAKNFLRHIIGNMTDIKQVNEFLKRVESTTSMDLTNMYIRDRRRR